MPWMPILIRKNDPDPPTLLNSLTFGVLGRVELEALAVKGELLLLRHLLGREEVRRLEEILHLFHPSFTRLG